MYIPPALLQVEIDPGAFNPQRIVENYLNFQLVFQNMDVIFAAFLVTISLALLAEVIGIVIGLVLALIRVSAPKALQLLSQAYVDVFRGSPLLVQITILYFTLPLIGIRFTSLFFAGLAALSLNGAAYVAEIFRAGIQSIDKGQMEAARASGLSYVQAMRYVIIPQAFRRVIPPLTNEFVALVKDTSLVSVIGLAELLRAARVLQSATFNGTPLIAAALLYLAVCVPLIYLANALDRRLNRRVA
ncbi:amino acid ABC transporter permease [Rubrobacter taiwanensis]|nr:amino acid ABC transporter permease [Rubrobacter taiwanensis]